MANWLSETMRPRMSRRSDLGDVQGRKHRRHADAQPAQDSGENELCHGGRQSRADGRDGKQHGSQQQDFFAAQSVAEHAGHRSADNAAQQGTRGHPTLLNRVESRNVPP